MFSQVKRIITFANYDFSDPRYWAMAMMWFDSVRPHFDGEIIVQSVQPVDHHFQLLPDDFCFQIIPEKYEGALAIGKFTLEQDLASHNLRYKMWHLCRQSKPCLYLDLDLVVFHPLRELIRRHDNLPIFFPNRNGGVILINDPSAMDWEGLIALANSHDYTPRGLGSDQVLYWTFFGDKYYGNEQQWNTWSKRTVLRHRGGKWDARNDHNFAPVYLSHYYGNGKPWQVNCPMYESYLEHFSG